MTLTATPDDSVPYRNFVQEGEPVDVPGLGFCYPIEPTIVAVRPDSPAAKAGLKAGDVIDKLIAQSGRAREEGREAQDGRGRIPLQGDAGDVVHRQGTG